MAARVFAFCPHPGVACSAAPTVVSKWIARSAFYPTLLWTYAKASVSSSNAWLNEIDSQVLLGALPLGKAAQLKELGVGLVVNTCEEWDGNRDEYKALGIEQVVLETIDYTAPKLADAERAVEAMQRFFDANPQVGWEARGCSPPLTVRGQGRVFIHWCAVARWGASEMPWASHGLLQ